MRGTEFAELNAFVAVAERSNFARAAGHLGVAPSTLSQTIRSLEERLGVRLLNRTTRSVSLTEAGERLLARVRPAVEELGAAVASISPFRDTPTGTLRLSVSSVSAHMILAPVVKDFLAAYPAIKLEVHVDNSTSDIVSGRFDAGIRYGRRIAQDMRVVRASAPSRVIAAASPSYLAAYARPEEPGDLQAHRCIRFRLGNEQMLPWEFRKNKKKMEVAVDGPLTANDLDLMVHAMLEGVGIGYVIEAYIAGFIAQGRLVPLLTEWSPPHDSYYLYYASRRQLPMPLKAFAAFLRNR